jgi:hypothetical protein
LAAIANDQREKKKTVIVCWSYPSGEILFQKKLDDEKMTGIKWNPFRPNVFAAFSYGVSCFFISNLFPSRARYTDIDVI